MLTVWSVYWGDKYHKGYVYALRDMVEKYLTIPHAFRCITTENLPGIQTRNPPVPYPGWWQKIGLFAPYVVTGPSIYFDLDVVIAGNIDYLADYTDEFTAPANWARSGHGGIQSSVMCWPGNWTEPYDRIKPLWQDRKDLPSGHTELGGKAYWGDQEFLWEILGNDWRRLPGVGSYKYHVQGSIPDWMKICVFHGKPDPHEVTDPCLLPFTETLHSHIRSNTANGSKKALAATG